MDNSTQKPVLIIFGPTASGKTALLERLFVSQEAFPKAFAEIISADSMQVYKKLNIGTAKPEKNILEQLPHHLIDVCEPHESFSTGDFVRLANAACADISGRGKLPVIAGGTAFYIRNFLYGLPVTPEANEDVRKKIKDRVQKEGAASLWQELYEKDPISACRIHKNDEYRLVRALEVCADSGRPLSSFALPDTMRSDYRFCLISLERPREQLYERIDMRTERMFEEGLLAEFRLLTEAGYGEKDAGMRAIGYREFFMVDGFDYSSEKTDAVKHLIKRDSRRYAKRQCTFFKNLPEVKAYNAQDFLGIYTTIRKFLDQYPPILLTDM